MDKSITSSLYDWQTPGIIPGFIREIEYAIDDLDEIDPALLKLISDYKIFDKRATRSDVWVDNKLPKNEFLNFRNDNPHVWQMRGPNMNPLSYALTYYYVKDLFIGKNIYSSGGW